MRNLTDKSGPLFDIGNLYATPGVQGTVPSEELHSALIRHVRGDWGDVSPEDDAENEFALDRYLRLFSVYHSKEGTKFWIITEADRSATTMLLPDEY